MYFPVQERVAFFPCTAVTRGTFAFISGGSGKMKSREENITRILNFILSIANAKVTDLFLVR